MKTSCATLLLLSFVGATACNTDSDLHLDAGGSIALRVDRPPMLRLGAIQGPEAEQFYQIRGAIRLHDGRIVVADGGSNELRFFDSEGVHLMTAGGDGAGPGEFKNLRWVQQTATDTLVAWDGGLGRISVFDPDGAPVRSFTLPSDPEFMLTIPEQVYSDGSILSMAGPPIEEADSSGSGYWSIVALTRTATDGSDLGRVALVHQQWCEEPGCARRITPFRSVWAAADDAVYYHKSGGSKVVRLTASGSHDLFDMADLPATPDTLTTVSELRVDRDGLIWIEILSGHWYGYSETGTLEYEARVPADLKVTEITSEYVLGITRDESGVEYVELLKLAPM